MLLMMHGVTMIINYKEKFSLPLLKQQPTLQPISLLQNPHQNLLQNQPKSQQMNQLQSLRQTQLMSLQMNQRLNLPQSHHQSLQ
jgi:hypothetical protein